MASSDAKSVVQYLAELPDDRRATISAVREVILRNLPEGYEETMQYGMVSYVVPFDAYPKTYNKQPLAVASLAAQKNYFSIYLYGIYSDPALAGWLRAAFEQAGKNLDMGKSCVRFRRLEDLPFDVIGQAIASVPVARFISAYEAVQRRE